jgi:hypothetical protein
MSQIGTQILGPVYIEILSEEAESENEVQEIDLEDLDRLGEKEEEEEPEPFPEDASGNHDKEEPENPEDEIQEQDPQKIMPRITGRIRQELPALMINWNRGDISMEEVQSIIEALIEENWPTCPAVLPVKEERLSAVLHAVLAQSSSHMPRDLPDSPFGVKRNLMREILRMQIIVESSSCFLDGPVNTSPRSRKICLQRKAIEGADLINRLCAEHVRLTNKHQLVTPQTLKMP